MKVIQANSKQFFQFDHLAKVGVLHFTSTRLGWGRDGYSRFTGDQADEYASFRGELARSLQIAAEKFVFPRQVHGDQVMVVDGPLHSADVPDTDALITNQPGICICVQTADCVPILLFDPVQRVVAAVHAGWRGTVNKIVAKTIHAMQRNFDSQPEDILAGIGPSIHLHAYEVGEEVMVAVRESFPDHRGLLKPADNAQKAYFDMWEANRMVLTDSGVPDGNIEVMGFCSYSHEPLFYSYRREGVKTGRMVSGIMLK